jgi:hypothetical protein
MSPRGSSDESKPDIYVGLLFVSMAALLIAMIFLLLELSQYQFKFPS